MGGEEGQVSRQQIQNGLRHRQRYEKNKRTNHIPQCDLRRGINRVRRNIAYAITPRSCPDAQIDLPGFLFARWAQFSDGDDPDE